jgi:hypothetical protein
MATFRWLAVAAAALLLLTLAPARAEDADAADDAKAAGVANLLVRKRLHAEFAATGYLAEGQNFTVQIDVVNIGTGDAHEVKVTDGWSDQTFNIVDGETTKTWPQIKAGASETFNITLVPTREGEIRGFPATVQYKTSENGQPQYGWSSPIRTFVVRAAARLCRGARARALTVTLSPPSRARARVHRCSRPTCMRASPPRAPWSASCSGAAWARPSSCRSLCTFCTCSRLSLACPRPSPTRRHPHYSGPRC